VKLKRHQHETIYKKLITTDASSIAEEYLKAARGDMSDVFTFPSEDIQVITNGLKGTKTAESALLIFNLLVEIIKSQSLELQSKSNILDYGCGWGRITRLLATLTKDKHVFGVDVDSRLISAATASAKSLNFSEIESMGILQFQNDFFQLIFANSVFSHLSEGSAIYTLGELLRILSPTGLLVISVLEKKEMDKFYLNSTQKIWIEKILGDRDSASKILSENGFVWGDTKRWHNYGIAIMSDKWLSKTLGSLNAKFTSCHRTAEKGSQNYMVIRRL
jgi:2-polyprenyl-3-methyl-5-hydroxy-6-metoxy-1,4-benzoquinol methylase